MKKSRQRAGTPQRRLNPDQLGAKGEARFPELCLDAGLECNKSGRDRTGWDFFVEFPFAASGEDLDRRPQPHACCVQLKTVWEGQKQVRLRLSSAERLAKAQMPAFICVLAVSGDNLEFTELRVMPVADGLLEAILKKLRQMQSAGRSTSINKTFIDIDVRGHGERLAPRGDDLRRSISAHIGADLAAYVARKVETIRTAGFGPAPVRGSFTVVAETQGDLSDFLLGLKALPASSFEAWESRWDIELPLRLPSPVAEIRAAPMPIPVDVAFRAAGGGHSATFRMDLLLQPFGPKGGVPEKQLLTHPNLRITIDGHSWQMQMSGPETVPTTYRTFQKLHWLAELMHRGEVDVRITRKGRLLRGMVLTTPARCKPADRMKAEEQLLARLADLMREAGVDDVTLPSPIDADFLHVVAAMHAMLTSPAAVSATFRVEVHDPTSFGPRIAEAIFIGGADLCESVLAFYAVCELSFAATDGPAVWEGTASGFSVRQVSLVENSAAALEQFREEAEALTGISVVLAP